MHKHNTRSQDITKNKADFSVRTARKEMPRWKKLNCPLIPSLGSPGVEQQSSDSIVRGGLCFLSIVKMLGNKIKSLLCQKKVRVFGKEIKGLFG